METADMNILREDCRNYNRIPAKSDAVRAVYGLLYFKEAQQESHDHIRIDAVMAFGFDMVISAVLPHLSSFRRGHWPQCGPLSP